VIRPKNLAGIVSRVLARVEITDIHTHLYDPRFRGLLLKGVDELLTYHYLVAETFRWTGKPIAEFWKLSKPLQADLVWKTCFLDHSPVSEACRGVLTTLSGLGLDPACRDLGVFRAKLGEMDPGEYLDKVFKVSGVREVVMTNDPLDDAERPEWEKGFHRDARFKASLRIDPLLLNWKKTWSRLRKMGYGVGDKLTPGTLKETRRFLSDWISRLNALYLAASFPPDFTYPGDPLISALLREAVLPVCADMNKPFALMMGVKRQVNPRLGLAGDGVGAASVGTVETLCRDFPGNKFLVTVLARETSTNWRWRPGNSGTSCLSAVGGS